MKVILFTHKIDIDGMGSVVLANLAFKNVTTVFCDTFEIDAKLKEFLDSKQILDFDKVFVTDLCPSLEMLKSINQNQNFKTKIVVLDHHATDEEKNNFDFVTIEVENKNSKLCGTSLFLDYLKNNYGFNPSPATEKFVELTRMYDTWEWKTKYNIDEPNDLNLLFMSAGKDKYVLMMTKKLMSEKTFKFSENEEKIIKNQKEIILKECQKLEQKMQIVTFEGLKTGIIHDSVGKFRNEMSEYLKSKNADIDCMFMINHERKTVSVRAIKEEIDVRAITVKFGGKAHKSSGGFPLSDEFLVLLKQCNNQKS